MTNAIEQAVVITSQEEINPSQSVTRLALFNPDGTAYEGTGEGVTTDQVIDAIANKPQLGGVSAIGGADIDPIDGEPTQSEFNEVVDRLNAVKVQFDHLLNALRAPSGPPIV